MWIKTTKDIKIPKDPLERIIGQDSTIEKVKSAIRQRRHLLLVGPPGVGKSMIAQAISYHLQKPKYQVSIVNNPENVQHPLVVLKSREQVEGDVIADVRWKTLSIEETPAIIAERLGFRCPTCGRIGSPDDACAFCGSEKKGREKTTPFEDMMTEVLEIGKKNGGTMVRAKIKTADKKEKIVAYQRWGDSIRMIDEKVLERQNPKNKQENVIIPLKRRTFVHATGASETELLGDVRHDPYGSHPEIGTPAYLRVVPGAIHEAHEGVLFIDELPHLGNLQNFILTAMQEKKFSIVGRNPQSAGAAVKVEDVPCDFLFVGACNIKDVPEILPPLRSRILGNGYELLLETTMPDTPNNKAKLRQFIAQEITTDGRIPNADADAIEDIIEEARRRARMFDNTRNAFTLRLRSLSGLIKMAGDFAVLEGCSRIKQKHILKSIAEAKPIEHKLKDRYGSMWNAQSQESVVKPDAGSMEGYV